MLISLITGVYLITYLLQSFFFADKLFAEETITNHNIVAIFVDETIANGLSNELTRYTTTYIPQRLDNAVPLVFPLSDDYTARDVQTTLDNLYFEGLADQTSTLT